MHREYYLRATIVSICALAMAVAVGAVALLPADIRAHAADSAALLAVTTAKNSNAQSDLTVAEDQLSQSNALITALNAGGSQVRFSAVVRAIVAAHSPVQISSFAVNRQGTSTIAVTLQGMAPTRDELLAFKARLEALSPGATVDLPIATLAKNANVPFSLRLTENLQ